MNEREELLACPFCGEKQISFNEPSKHYRYGSINCPACLVVMPGEVRDEKELVGCWNTRASVAQPSSEPVAWTNAAQLGFLKSFARVPMAMWGERGTAADIPLYASPLTSTPSEPAQPSPELTPEMLQAGAEALADDVWHPPQKFESLRPSDVNKYRRQALLVLKAAYSVSSTHYQPEEITKEEMDAIEDAAVAGAALARRQRCAKCGCETGGEEALVKGEILCHPCADSVSSTEPSPAPESCRYCNGTKRALYFTEQGWAQEWRDCHVCSLPGDVGGGK